MILGSARVLTDGWTFMSRMQENKKKHVVGDTDTVGALFVGMFS